MKRYYREWVQSKDLLGFEVKVKQTDLFIQAERNLQKEALDQVLKLRTIIETYIENRPEFLSSLVPIEPDPLAPPIIREMIEASNAFEVGPMASVAGVIAQYVGESLLEYTSQVVVENGGDVYANLNRPFRVNVLPWLRDLKKEGGFIVEIRDEIMPIAICSSSGKIGHSISMGRSDLACVVSGSGAISDAAATLAGNLLKKGGDIQRVIERLRRDPRILGGMLVVGSHVGIWGDLSLVA